MKKVYLAHPISTTGEFKDSIRVANEIRKLGFKVYAASENDSINDKSNDPTPMDIYNGDIPELLSSDIIVVNLTGGNMDGTVFELGGVVLWDEAVAKFMEYHKKVTEYLKQYDIKIPFDHPFKHIEIIVYTSNARILQPQFHKGVASAHLNHLLLGGSDVQGEFVGSEEDMLKKLKTLI